MGRMAEAYLSQEGTQPPSPGRLQSTDRGLNSRRVSTAESYPHQPAIGKTNTSAMAAKSTKPRFNEKQKRVLAFLCTDDLTNTEIFARAAGLNRKQLARYCELRALERGLQPRAGELVLKGKVFDSGRTRKNPNGRAETVWTTLDPNTPKLPEGRLL